MLKPFCRQFENPGDVHVAEDGSRVGEPAEETIVYFAWDSRSGLAAVLPPQVAT